MVRMIVESATSLQYTQDGEYSLAPIWGFSRQKTGWEDILLLQHRVFWSCCCLSVESCNNLRSSLSTCFNTIEQSTNLRWFDTQTNPEDRESIYSRQFSKPGTKNSQLLMSNWHILIHMCLEQAIFFTLRGEKSCLWKHGGMSPWPVTTRGPIFSGIWRCCNSWTAGAARHRAPRLLTRKKMLLFKDLTYMENPMAPQKCVKHHL